MIQDTTHIGILEFYSTTNIHRVQNMKRQKKKNNEFLTWQQTAHERKNNEFLAWQQTTESLFTVGIVVDKYLRQTKKCSGTKMLQNLPPRLRST